MSVMDMRGYSGGREGLRQLIEYTGLSGISMVEVGSYAGQSAEVFANMPQVREIWCVDPWKPGYDDSDKASHSDMSEVELAFDEVAAKHPDKIRKFKGVLEDFHDEYPNVRPDLVYIDACHLYEHVKSDIAVSMSMGPKFVAGHDFPFEGVSKAVYDIGGPSETFKDGSWVKRVRTFRSFSVDEMMEHSFALAVSGEEYGRFAERMESAGFGKIPPMYDGRFPACSVPNGMDACALSHLELIKAAKSLNFPQITIFESDAYPATNCRDELGRFLDGGIPDDATEITFGNLHFVRRHDLAGKHGLFDTDGRFGRIKGDLWGTHAATVFRSGYDQWIENFISHRPLIHADFYNTLTGKCYATERSFFIQVKDRLQYPTWIADPQNLNDFPGYPGFM